MKADWGVTFKTRDTTDQQVPPAAASRRDKEEVSTQERKENSPASALSLDF